MAKINSYKTSSVCKTKGLLISVSSRRLKAKLCHVFALAAAALSLASCASFQGPSSFSSSVGDLTLPKFSGGSDQPAISLHGERQVYRPESEIRFDWPVEEARMTRGFIVKSSRSHWGLDLANRKGTPILASESGVVIYAGQGFRGYGKLIVIEHDDTWATLYSHLHRINVKEGQAVKRGQKIGTMGRTGRATGVHLHFEIRHKKQPVNPLAYLPPKFSGKLSQAESERHEH